MKNKNIDYRNNKAIENFKSDKPKEIKGFRLQAKKLFLTYPQCDIQLEYFEQEMSNKLKRYGIKEYLYVIEEHQDGKPHIHAYVELEKKSDIKNENVLDIGKEDHKFHGNYAAARNHRSVIEYLMKDSKEFEDKDVIRISNGIKIRLGKVNEYLNTDEAMIKLATEGKIDQAMELIKRENPKRYLREGKSLERTLQEIFMKKIGLRSKFPIECFQIPERIKKAIKLFKESFEVGEARVFVLQGEPATGKTELACAILESWGMRVFIVNHVEDLTFFNPNEHDCIIFDDPDFSGISREAIINLFDSKNRIVKVRYGHARIPENTPKIITTNKPLENLNDNFRDQAIKRRTITARIPRDIRLFNRKLTEEHLIKNSKEVIRIRKVEELDIRCREFQEEEFFNVLEDKNREQDQLVQKSEEYKRKREDYITKINEEKNQGEINTNEYMKKLYEYDKRNNPGRILLKTREYKTDKLCKDQEMKDIF
jgi:uncharacterized protein YlaN (UPF0358 family)